MTFARSGNPYLHVEDLVKYVWIRHRFEILCGTRFLEPVTDVERAFAIATMSNMKLLSTKDALKMQMERINKRKWKRAANVPASKEVEQVERVEPIEPLTLSKKAKKHLHPDDESSGKGLVMKFPSDVSIYSYPGPMLKRSDQLLFPEDESRLLKIGASRATNWGVVGAYQALQAQLFLRKNVKSLSKKVSSLTSSNAKMKKDLNEAKYVEAGAKEAMKGAVEKLSEADAFERLDKAVDKAVIETRGKLMQEYLLGQNDTWDAEKKINLWEQWKKLKALDIDDEGDDGEKGVEPNEQIESINERVSEDNAEIDLLILP
ncbi:hypothetical protein Q3G72_016580 [Acer saccharum]|nr:hypothetical protein Q3G72_016580 [Acer saccharum]